MTDLLTPSTFDPPDQPSTDRRGTCKRPQREMDTRLAHLPFLFRLTWFVLSAATAWLSANLLDAGLHAPGSLIAQGLGALAGPERMALVWLAGGSVVLIAVDAALLWLRCSELRGAWARALRVCVAVRRVVRELALMAHVLLAGCWAWVAVAAGQAHDVPGALPRLLLTNVALGLSCACIDAVAKNRVRGVV